MTFRPGFPPPLSYAGVYNLYSNPNYFSLIAVTEKQHWKKAPIAPPLPPW